MSLFRFRKDYIIVFKYIAVICLRILIVLVDLVQYNFAHLAYVLCMCLLYSLYYNLKVLTRNVIVMKSNSAICKTIYNLLIKTFTT